MGEQSSPDFDLYFDVSVDILTAMESTAVKQHKHPDICGMLKSASEELERDRRPEVTVQPYACIEPSRPEWFDGCEHGFTVRDFLAFHLDLSR